MFKLKNIVLTGLVALCSFSVNIQANELFGNTKGSLIEKNNIFNMEKTSSGPLEVEQAFQPDFSLNKDSFDVTFNLQNKYYIYQDKIKLSVNGKSYNLEMPKPIVKNDPVFGTVNVFENYTTFKTHINSKDDLLNISLQYQGCSEEFKICYPVEIKKISLNNIYQDKYKEEPVDTVKEIIIEKDSSIFDKASDATFISKFIAKENYAVTLSIFLLFGILMAFTPCVFPMIPILSGLIVKDNKRHPFVLSSLYVLGIALCYASIGVVLKLINFNIQIALQNIYLLIVTSILMFVLALNMFGFINLSMPASIQSKLHNKTVDLEKNKSPFKLIAIGYLSALILSPCAVAPLAGTLLFASQYDSIVYSSLLLFTLGLGSGIPLILWGTSMKKILPKSGMWMYEVKNFIGMLLIAVGLYLISKLIPWNDGSLLSAIYRTVVFGSVIGYVIKFFDFNLRNKIVSFIISVLIIFSFNISNNAHIVKNENAKNDFIKIEKIEDIKTDQLSMLYVGADWCVSCKEMENYTFSDQTVINELKNYKVYFLDITEMSDSKKEILNKFNLQIAPFYVLYDKEGNQKNEIHIGYIEKNKFLEILKN
jgi:thiol:disulfide interchange protein DsbD